MNMSERLAGRVAVVTGGGSGIGLATVRRFAAEGAKVVVGDIDPDAGEKAANEAGGLCVKVDVSDEEQVKNLFNAAEDAYGAVDIAFNNAGISPPEDASITETSLDAPANRDSKPAVRPLRAYGDFMGYVVANGRRRVTFEFAPASFREGLWMSVAGAALLCIAVAWAEMRFR